MGNWPETIWLVKHTPPSQWHGEQVDKVEEVRLRDQAVERAVYSSFEEAPQPPLPSPVPALTAFSTNTSKVLYSRDTNNYITVMLSSKGTCSGGSRPARELSFPPNKIATALGVLSAKISCGKMSFAPLSVLARDICPPLQDVCQPCPPCSLERALHH